MNDYTDDQSPTAQYSEDTRPPKRQKRANADEEAGDTRTPRHSKACSNCRRLKVKCDSTEAGRGSSDCSRCLRLHLKCLREKRLWTASVTQNVDQEPLQLTITKLERALEDILEKLDMPALDLYALPKCGRRRARLEAFPKLPEVST